MDYIMAIIGSLFIFFGVIICIMSVVEQDPKCFLQAALIVLAGIAGVVLPWFVSVCMFLGVGFLLCFK